VFTQSRGLPQPPARFCSESSSDAVVGSAARGSPCQVCNGSVVSSDLSNDFGDAAQRLDHSLRLVWPLPGWRAVATEGGRGGVSSG
jgi:hypothetical protein